MTNLFRVTLGVLLILVLFIAATMGMFLDYKQKHINDEISYYYSKRDELFLQEQKLGKMIIELNNTLEIEKEKNAKLSEKVSLIEKEPTTVSAPPIAKPVAPVVQPVRRVTRAS